MPNWCVNRLAIAGPPAAVKLLVEELASPDAALDFAALRPTPPELLADGEHRGGVRGAHASGHEGRDPPADLGRGTVEVVPGPTQH